jgi:hypothetical protein
LDLPSSKLVRSKAGGMPRTNVRKLLIPGSALWEITPFPGPKYYLSGTWQVGCMSHPALQETRDRRRVSCFREPRDTMRLVESAG